MPRGSRGRGGRSRSGRKEAEGREDNLTTRQLMEHIQGEGSEVSSLADVPSSTLGKVKLSTESTVMKVSAKIGAVMHIHHCLPLYHTPRGCSKSFWL